MHHTDEIRYGASTLFKYTPSADNIAITSDPGATITIYNPSGTELVAATAMTWNDTDDRLEYSIDATDTGNWNLGLWYRSMIQFTVDSVGRIFNLRFGVIADPWESNVTAKDITERSPGIIAYQDDFSDSDFVAEIRNAEWAMRADLRERQKPFTAGMIIDKDGLDLALICKTLNLLWARVAGDGYQASRYLGEYQQRIGALMGSVLLDEDQDQLVDEDPQDRSGACILP